MPDKNNSAPPSNEQIRQRAYEIYLARGGEDGHDLSDWIEATRELSESNEQESVSAQKTRTAVPGRRA
jgi:hypothetical protein